MGVFNFTLSDLNANKQGNLSKRQTRIAEASQPNVLVQLILLGHVGVIIGVMALIVLSSGATTERLLFLAGGSVVVLSPFLYAMGRMSNTQKGGLSAEDLQSGEVLSVCGEVVVHKAETIKQPHRIVIADKRFIIPKDALDLFDPEQQYCIYYAPHSRKIVAVDDMR
jgi:hypothetical protein